MTRSSYDEVKARCGLTSIFHPAANRGQGVLSRIYSAGWPMIAAGSDVMACYCQNVPLRRQGVIVIDRIPTSCWVAQIVGGWILSRMA